MTNDNFNNAARAYAEQACYQDENRPIAEAGFRAGWKAARTYLAAQEPTGAEAEAAAEAICSGEGGCDPCFNWDGSVDGGCTYCTRHARAALSAARAARRDEEKR